MEQMKSLTREIENTASAAELEKSVKKLSCWLIEYAKDERLTLGLAVVEAMANYVQYEHRVEKGTA